MKKYIKSNSESNRKYYAYPIKEINRLIEDYLNYTGENRDDFLIGPEGFEDLGEDTIVTEPVYYAYIANSDMTDIDVAFVSKDENVVSGLSENSEDVRLLLDSGYREEEAGIEFDEVMDQFEIKGITILDDESGNLYHLGASVIFNTKIERLIDRCITMYGCRYADDIYDSLMKNHGDKVIDDLYVSDKFSNMIIPVKKEHWRF